ncbi:plasmid mobilization relaxosome protein MobC [Brevibacillus centrosporus]|uniref:plasmid mobilization protein n=1 Tax=Brevibacillus centrosporus TaxID=54910 RepID=UPI003D196E77
MTRRSGSENRVKRKTEYFRVSEEEKQQILDNATRAGKKTNDYIRSVLLSKRIKQPKVDHAAGLEIAQELRRIGVNLNQLTKLAHMGLIDDCSVELSKIREVLQESLRKL